MSKHGAKISADKRKAQIRQERLESLQRAAAARQPVAYALFIDDERDPKYYTDHWSCELTVRVARSSADARAIVELYGIPAHIALDHDLGGDDTTMEFLNWFRYERKPSRIPSYSVHSHNPVGAKNMKQFMEDWEDSESESPLLHTLVVSVCAVTSLFKK